MLSTTVLRATMGVSRARLARHKVIMFGSVALSTHSIADYTPIVGAGAINVAEPLRGRQFLALSSPGASDAAAGTRIGTNHLITHHMAGYLKLSQHLSCKCRSSPTTPAQNRES